MLKNPESAFYRLSRIMPVGGRMYFWRKIQVAGFELWFCHRDLNFRKFLNSLYQGFLTYKTGTTKLPKNS